MTIQIDMFDFWFFVFLMFGQYVISIFLVVKYWKHGEAIKREVEDIINHSMKHIKENLEGHSDKQIEIYNEYVEQAKELAEEFEDARKKQYQNIENMQRVHAQIDQNINIVVSKLQELEKKINKGIMERDGKIYRKNKEIEKLKERIEKLKEQMRIIDED